MTRLTLLALFLTAAVAPAADYPTVVLGNDRIKVTVRTPDAEKGYYRGTRFDWAGVIGPVEFDGKKVFLPWKDKHDPTNNDDITGPCDEFGNTTPLNFKEAKAGERFVKIGVGELTKGTDNEYAFWKKYAIAKPGSWEVRSGDNVVTFSQALTTDFGFAYEYRKILRLTQGGFTLSYALRNRGTKRIVTDVYNHNFFNVAGSSTGKGFGVTFPFTPKPKESKERFAELVAADGPALNFRGELDKGSIYTLLDGFGPDAKDARFVLHGGGVRMSVTGDKPLSKVALWGVKTTLCPEPFLAIDLAPRESMSWQWAYQFEAK
jgi:hypothetical protein